MEAKFYSKDDNNNVTCNLCPHNCKIYEDKIGFCGARKNINGILQAMNYGQCTSLALDPIEKKPLYHFHPHSKILSYGSFGCNMKCSFCQNWTISQSAPKTEFISPEKLARFAKETADNIGVAFTYNEPLIAIEYLIDAAKIIKQNGQKIVVVTNGNINPEPFEKVLSFVDAFNIDMKAFNEDFYEKYGGDLEIVKQNIKRASKSTHVEITNLIIPDENDSEEEMTALSTFLANISNEIPLHISRFFPQHKMLNKQPTPLETIHRLSDIARKKLKHVHEGNV